jgi:hypothetical protein
MSSSLTSKIKAVADSHKKMNANAKSLTLVVGAYVVTMGVAVFIIAFAIMILMGTTHCSTMSQALMALGSTIAMVFLTSIIVVGVAVWKIYPSFAGRLVIMAVYGAAMLVSYVVIAFGLLVVFNC